MSGLSYDDECWSEVPSEAFVDAIKARIATVESQRPHYPHGMSSIGYCRAMQKFKKTFYKPFDGFGAVTPGTALHRYMQEAVFPMGAEINVPYFTPRGLTTPKFEPVAVMGHEVPVFLYRGTWLWKKSDIDTLLFSELHQEYVLVDYKSTSKQMKYVKSPDPRHIMQLSVYLYCFSKAWNAKARGIILYVEKNNWTEMKAFEVRLDVPQVEKWLDRVWAMEQAPIKTLEEDWWAICDGLADWSDTKKPYRRQCKFCDYRLECAATLGVVAEDLIDVDSPRRFELDKVLDRVTK